MQKWMFAALLVVQAHFAASYLVPLDSAGKKTFGGLLGWAWPWAYGDGGLFGRIYQGDGGFPIAGFFIAVTAAGLLLLAAMAVVGLWLPFGWWPFLAGAGVVLELVLMVGFFGPTKLLPIALALVVLAAAVGRYSPQVA